MCSRSPKTSLSEFKSITQRLATQRNLVKRAETERLIDSLIADLTNERKTFSK
ncbi:hypothetical protein FFLO_07222 [Filobasidium floriforme]|uniref:Uncharacterized protein n=1 Tax=Filobasidium floriforme TaxID=5210 RepID=A0A8K0JDQ3_9TREE|nr:hypothetical protein FFLO_07222 [Filobasidium floriforme]